MEKNIKMKDIKELGEQLGELQRVCREKKIPVMIAFEGYGAAGKGLQIGNLIQALDPRGFKVYAVKNETEEEWMHPFMWRFWTKIPEKGRIAIFDTSWYRRVMIERFEGKTPEKELEKDFASIRAFEKQLTDDGMVIIKLFLKIDRKEQKKRFEKLLASKDTAWRVSKGDLKRNHDFKEYKAINEEMLRKTDADYAPWTVINAAKKKEAKVAVYQAVIQAMEEAVARKELEEKGIGRPSTYSPTIQTILDRGYIVKDGKKLVSTELGELIVNMLTTYFKDIINIPFTANLETELDEIAEHEANKETVLENFYEPFSHLLQKADKEIETIEAPVEVSDVKCEKCGRMMVYKQGRYGKFLACPGFPECRNTKPILKKSRRKMPGTAAAILSSAKQKLVRYFTAAPTIRSASLPPGTSRQSSIAPNADIILYEKTDRNGNKKLFCTNENCEDAVKTYKGKAAANAKSK